MDDLLRMRKPYGVEHLKKQLQAIGNTQALRRAPLRQRFALDVLHGQVRNPAGVDSRVVEARDIRMLEARQDIALYSETLRQIPPQVGEQRQFDGHFALESAVRATRQPYLGHASGAERTKQFIRPDICAGAP